MTKASYQITSTKSGKSTAVRFGRSGQVKLKQTAFPTLRTTKMGSRDQYSSAKKGSGTLSTRTKKERSTAAFNRKKCHISKKNKKNKNTPDANPKKDSGSGIDRKSDGRSKVSFSIHSKQIKVCFPWELKMFICFSH